MANLRATIRTKSKPVHRLAASVIEAELSTMTGGVRVTLDKDGRFVVYTGPAGSIRKQTAVGYV